MLVITRQSINALLPIEVIVAGRMLLLFELFIDVNFNIPLNALASIVVIATKLSLSSTLMYPVGIFNSVTSLTSSNA